MVFHPAPTGAGDPDWGQFPGLRYAPFGATFDPSLRDERLRVAGRGVEPSWPG
jgi:hypothetical protein